MRWMLFIAANLNLSIWQVEITQQHSTTKVLIYININKGGQIREVDFY